jgi:type I restriction enzyme S subunit
MKLAELVSEVRDLRAPSDVSALPYVGLEHIGKGTLSLVGRGVAGDVTSTKKAFRPGDILLGALRPYFRKVVLARFDGVCSTDITVLRPLDRADAAFAFYVIASPGFIQRATRASNGTGMPRARWRDLSGFELGALSRAARRRIGDTLAPYDELIDKNRERIVRLEELVRTLYREWFVDRRLPGAPRARAVESRARGVPPGWTSHRLADHVDEIRLTVDPRDVAPDTPYFGLEHLPRRSTTLGAWGRAGEVTSSKLASLPGDILFGKIRPYFHKVGVSPVAAVCSTDAVVLRPVREELRAVVLGCVSRDDFVARASVSSSGAKMPRARWDLLRQEPLPLPPAPWLARFDDLAGSAVKLASVLALENRALAAARDLLLPRLLGAS